MLMRKRCGSFPRPHPPYRARQRHVRHSVTSILYVVKGTQLRQYTRDPANSAPVYHGMGGSKGVAVSLVRFPVSFLVTNMRIAEVSENSE